MSGLRTLRRGTLASFVAPGLIKYKASVMADGPSSFHTCQAADIVSNLPQDISGNGLHMTTRNGAVVNDAAAGPAADVTSMEFAGGRYVNRTGVATSALNNWALEFWFNYVAGSGDRWFTNGHWNADGGYTILAGSGAMQGLNDGITFLTASNGSISPGWKHLVMERRSGDWNYYINGVLDSASPVYSGAPHDPTGGGIMIGSYNSGALQARTCMNAVYGTLPAATRWLAHYHAMVG